MRVPADNHLAEEHVHVDHAWVGIALDPHPADQPAHPFGWYTAEEIQELPMFEDARLLAKVLFTCVADLAADNLAGAGILRRSPLPLADMHQGTGTPGPAGASVKSGPVPSFAQAVAQQRKSQARDFLACVADPLLHEVHGSGLVA